MAAEVAPIQQALSTAPAGKRIYPSIIAVMRDVGAIGKDRRNDVQRYSFRGIDDVYNELHEHLAKHGVFTVPRVISERSEERQTKSGGASIYRILTIAFTFFAEDGSSIEAVMVGEGMDSGDKASNKAMAVAHKYALMQVFAIPTEETKDPELPPPGATKEDLELAPRQQPQQQSKGDPRKDQSKPAGGAVYDGSPSCQKSLRIRFERFGCTDEKLMWKCDAAIRGVPLSEAPAAIEDWIREFAPEYAPEGKA